MPMRTHGVYTPAMDLRRSSPGLHCTAGGCSAGGCLGLVSKPVRLLVGPVCQGAPPQHCGASCSPKSWPSLATACKQLNRTAAASPQHVGGGPNARSSANKAITKAGATRSTLRVPSLMWCHHSALIAWAVRNKNLRALRPTPRQPHMKQRMMAALSKRKLPLMTRLAPGSGVSLEGCGAGCDGGGGWPRAAGRLAGGWRGGAWGAAEGGGGAACGAAAACASWAFCFLGLMSPQGAGGMPSCLRRALIQARRLRTNGWTCSQGAHAGRTQG